MDNRVITLVVDHDGRQQPVFTSVQLYHYVMMQAVNSIRQVYYIVDQ